MNDKKYYKRGARSYTIKFKILRESTIYINHIRDINWSQVSRELGVSRQYLYQALTCETIIPYHLYIKLIDILDKKLDYDYKKAQ